MRRLSILLFGALLAAACGRATQPVPEALAGIREAVARIDSSVTAMYGWEPRDSTYDRRVDTLVAEVMNSHDAYTEGYGPLSEATYGVDQSAYDQARGTWAAFKRLCDEDRYGEALDFYLGVNAAGERNAGDFLVFLKHSSQRYAFLSQVLFPLLREYREGRSALDTYIGVLEFEKVLEEGAIALQAEGNGYVPEVYPFVLRDLGYCLGAVGRMDEAEDLFRDIVSGIYGLCGDVLYANYCGTQYLASLYCAGGREDLAVAAWQNLRDHVLDSGSGYDNLRAAECLERIMAELDALEGGGPSAAGGAEKIL